WNGDFFEESSLTRLGMEYYLSHRGLPCPMNGIPVVGCIARVTVVDITGIHYLIICFCQCTDAPDAEKQLFQMGLFPASFTWPRTTFTFALLNDFALLHL
ncbi:uncharacterized protein F5891DRAFT_912964, partial [Suillus fuscotomentosus]